MNEAFVEVNGVRTKIVTWGRWIEESPGTTKDIIIIIPGNPGVVSFYKKFARTLFERTEIPVWCVGHSGHNFADKTSTSIPSFELHSQLYGLKGQVDHKIEFFKKFVPADARVHLIGHSIGAYMAVEILEHPDVRAKVDKAYLLFPTIERMAKTKNGRFLNTFVRPIVPLILFLTWIFTILPNFVASLLLYIYMFISNIPRNLHSDSIKDLLKPGILRRVFFLAFEEMDLVNEKNVAVLQRNVGKLKFYYGKSDGWTPNEYYENIKRDVPNIDVELTDFDHTFVFNRSGDVATKVSDWIKGK